MRFLRLPPVLPALFTLSGALVHRLVWQFELMSAPWAVISGVVIMALAVLMFAAAVLTLRRHGESPDVGKPTREVVSDGIYAGSRNPIYLSFLLFVFGCGCLANSLAVLLAVVPSFAVLNWWTVPREERYLRRRLGDEYGAYCARVRRWL